MKTEKHPSSPSAGLLDPVLAGSPEMQEYCDLCGETSRGRVYSTCSGYRLLRCEQCGLIWSNPLRAGERSADPARESLIRQTYLANESAQKQRFRKQLQIFLRKTGLRDPKAIRILEVGSNLGLFLDVCDELGIEAVGCDIDADAVRHANRARERVRLGTLDETYSGQTFDAVVALNLIEHVPHPGQFLAEVRKVLKPGGTLMLETPIQESLFHRIGRLGDLCTRGRVTLYGVGPGGHTYKFSRNTLRHLCERYGWEILYWKNVPSPWGEISRNSSVLPSDHALLYRLSLPVLYAAAAVLGQGNRLFVLLRKTSDSVHSSRQTGVDRGRV